MDSYLVEKENMSYLVERENMLKRSLSPRRIVGGSPIRYSPSARTKSPLNGLYERRVFDTRYVSHLPSASLAPPLTPLVDVQLKDLSKPPPLVSYTSTTMPATLAAARSSRYLRESPPRPLGPSRASGERLSVGSANRSKMEEVLRNQSPGSKPTSMAQTQQSKGSLREKPLGSVKEASIKDEKKDDKEKDKPKGNKDANDDFKDERGLFNVGGED